MQEKTKIFFVYTTKTISTIVDSDGTNIYVRGVYTTKTISTIVDDRQGDCYVRGLYDQNNFYYCRWMGSGKRKSLVYTTKTISTIVDVGVLWMVVLLSIRPKQFLLL